MRFNRKQRRQMQKEFSYKQYAEQKKQEQLFKKRQIAINSFHESWKAAVSEAVPLWLQRLSLFIPPKRYLDFITKLLLKYQSKCDVYAKKILFGEMPHWRKSFNVTIIGWTIVIAAFILRDWMLHIRHFVRCFGISTKIKQTSDSKFSMTVKYFGSVITEKSIEV
jgi:hypothetical protein